MVTEGQLLWTPPADFAAGSHLARYQSWLRDSRGLDLPEYSALWKWSVTDLDAFWRSLWDYFEVMHDGTFAHAIDRRAMPGARWFEGARVNYAEHLLRGQRRDGGRGVVFHHLSECRALDTMSWAELAAKVRAVSYTHL